MAEYTIESINNTGIIIEDNIAQLKEQILSKFKSVFTSKYLTVEFRPLISTLITDDEAKAQNNHEYTYGTFYSIKLKNHNDCELFTPIHAKVPIAINVDQAEELESCIKNIINALDHLDECVGSLQEFVHSA